MWELDYKESWMPKNDASELWCWRRLWRVPWTARRSNQSILKEIGPRCSLEGLILKLKLHPVLWPPVKSWLIWKDPDAGKDWGQEEKGPTEDEMVGWHHQWTWVWVDSGGWWWTGRPGMLQCMGLQRVRHDWTTELNWTVSGCRGRSMWQLSWKNFAFASYIGDTELRHLDLSQQAKPGPR